MSFKNLLSLAIIFFVSSQLCFASDEYVEEVTYSVGMVNASYTEGQGGFTGQNVEQPASGSVSSISGNVNWKFAPGLDKSYYFSGTFPLMANPLGSYFGGHMGVEFYFGDNIGSRLKLNNSGTSLKMKPSGSLFFWGLEGGMGYLVYSTETAKKTDLLLDLGAFVGLSYAIGEKWNLRAQVGYGRGTGVTTTTSEMKMFIGVTRFLGD